MAKCWALCAALLISSTCCSETWKILSLEWPPYASAELPNQGRAIERLRTILEGQGITLEVTFMDWEEAQKQARNGEYFGYYPAWPEEIKAGFFASPAIDWSLISVILPAHHTFAFTNLETLFKQQKVGLVDSYAYPDEITQLQKQYDSHIVYSKDDQALLTLFESRKIDAAIADPFVFLYYSDANQFDHNIMLMENELVIAIWDTQENRKKAMRYLSQ